jgi:tetratricopeptide (TPR) repeat protein
LTHIDEQGNDSPPILIANSTAANRAVNLPEFVNMPTDGIEQIDSPAAEFYRVMDDASALEGKQDYAGALNKWKEALAMNPEDARVNNGLGSALIVSGDPQGAIPYLKKATQLNGEFVEAQFNLGAALMRTHRLQEAIDTWKDVIRLRPDYTAGHEGLGFAYYLNENYSASLYHLRLALDGEPDRVSVLTLAASLMATSPDAMLRNGHEAIVLADRANQLTNEQDISVLDTLSAGYAECHRFDQAVQTEHRALSLASQKGDADMVARLTAHLQMYLSNAPVRTSADDGIL